MPRSNLLHTQVLATTYAASNMCSIRRLRIWIDSIHYTNGTENVKGTFSTPLYSCYVISSLKLSLKTWSKYYKYLGALLHLAASKG